MRRVFAGLLSAFLVVLGVARVPAIAASLPNPAKLCSLIGEKNGDDETWQKTTASDHHWTCGGSAHLFATVDQVRQGDGDVWMIDYNAEGLTEARATQFYFNLHIYSATLWNDRIKAAILDRFSAIFAASNAGPVPADVVQAITQVKSTTISTALGSVQTRFTPGNGPQYPNIGSTFEVMLIEPSIEAGELHFSYEYRQGQFLRQATGTVKDIRGFSNALAALRPPPGAHGGYGLIGDDSLLGKEPGYGLSQLGLVARQYVTFDTLRVVQPSGWENIGVQSGTFTNVVQMNDTTLGWVFFDLRPKFEADLKARIP